MGSTHLVTGTIAAAGTSVALAQLGVPVGIAMLAIPAGAYSALLPDLDHPKGTVTWSLPPVTNFLSWTIRGWPLTMRWPRRIVVQRIVHWHIEWNERHYHLLPWHVVHRYQTHTAPAAILFGLVLTAPLWWLPPPIGPYWWAIGVAVTLGCVTHMWGDMRTTGGLPRRGGGRRTIGKTFDVGSPHEHWLRNVIYTPTASVAVVAALLAIPRLAPAV